MKTTVLKVTLILSFVVSPLLAQVNTSSLRVGEINPYVSEYLQPVSIALSTGMGSGWAHEARVHGKLGFDISFSGVGVKVPTEGMSFSVSALSEMAADGYSFMDGSAVVSDLPTISSPNATDVTMGRDLSISSNGVSGSQRVAIPAFDGLDIPYVPNASIQAAVGLPKGTEVIVRYVPELSGTINSLINDDFSVEKMNMWGLGVKHDIKQWIPVVKNIPLLELSGLFSYSKFSFAMTSTDFLIDPQTIADASGMSVKTNDYSKSSIYEGQGLDLEMSSYTGSLLFGMTIPVVRPFIAVGFNTSSLDAGLTGTFPEVTINVDDPSTPQIEVLATEEDPINIDTNKTFFNFQAGLNFKIAFFSIHAQYTYQEYSMYSAGIAFGMR